jgi:uncharacterized protein YkwD
MAVEDRDWYTQPEPPPPKRFSLGSVFLLVALFVLLLAVVGLKWMQGSRSDFYGEEQSRVGAVKFTIVPGLPALTIRKGDVYPENDPWKEYLADEQTCPGGERTDLPLDEQANIMVCLVNYARQRRGLSTLVTYPLLNDTSLLKAGKIVRCNDFAHNACGEAPEDDTRAAGYYGAWGENLYVGEERLGAPRVALDGWLNSPGHRDNLFQPEWRSQGIAVMRAGRFSRYSNATLWVNEFAAS